MIYCIVKKPEEYSVDLGGMLTGLWQNYGGDPYLFSLLSRTSSSFFFYEPGMEGMDQANRIVSLADIEFWEKTLLEEVAGVPIKHMLETMGPREMVDFIFEHKPGYLPLNKLMGGNDGKIDPLWFCMYLRALQYEKYARGKRVTKGNVIEAVFRSTLQPAEDAFLEGQKDLLRKAMEERIKNAK